MREAVSTYIDGRATDILGFYAAQAKDVKNGVMVMKIGVIVVKTDVGLSR